MSTIRLTVRTPQDTVFDDEVEEVVLPLSDGWIGILPGHAEFVARLMAGNFVIRLVGHERHGATVGGTMRVRGDRALILTGAATIDHDFDQLESDVSEQFERSISAEKEAEKHFDRVYRQMARAFRGGRSRD